MRDVAEAEAMDQLTTTRACRCHDFTMVSATMLNVRSYYEWGVEEAEIAMYEIAWKPRLMMSMS